MIKQAFGWEVKNLDEAGYIEGVAAGYGNVDFGGDRILPGALTKSLAGRNRIPMLFGHDGNRPIGSWSKFTETDAGLQVAGKISIKTPDGQLAYELAKDGALAGLSIGYQPTAEPKMVGKVRELAELYLHEVSLVSVGMNGNAVVTGVKTIDDLRARLVAGDRLTEREWETVLKKGFGLSNSEAERAVRINLKGQGEPDDTADPMAAFWAAMRDAPIEDLTGE